MADQRSVMKEYRQLEQKRQAGGLTREEEARLAQLRDLVGPETGVGGSKAGFDVNAAAARLRESLLPAGLRNRPPPMPEPSAEPEPPAAPEAPVGDAAGLAAAWSDAPFAPLTQESGLSADALFDPGTLGAEPAAEPAWDPNAQPYDPNAQPYDPNAPAYDAGAAAWDPNAQPYDPNAQPYDPNAPAYDAGAAAWDPNAQPYDPNAQPYDPNAPAYDAGAAAWDPNAQPYDANAAQAWDAEAAPQWDAAVQPALDPNLAAPWGEPSGEAAAPTETATETPDALDAGLPVAPAEPGWEEAEGAAPLPEAGAWDAGAPGAELDAGPEPALETEPEVAPEPEAALEPEPEPDLETAPVLEGEPGAPLAPEPGLDGELEPEPASAPEAGFDVEPQPAWEAALEPAAEPAAEGLLPFDAEAASAVEPGATPDGWSAAPGTELPEFGSEEELSPEQPAQVDALPAEEAQGLLAPLGAGQELTSDDDAFAQGFHLESNGSFGGETAPAAPAWSARPAGSEAEAWESAPALDLGAMAPASGVPHLDLAPAPTVDPLDEIEVEEIPIVDGTELLEELPPAAAAPTSPPPAPPRSAVPPPAPAIAAPPAAAAPVRVAGSHRVVVHTLEGQVKRGVIADVTLGAGDLPLAPQPDAAPEVLADGKVKAIFFMLDPGEKAPVPEGKKVRVTFTDGRQIAGFSPDYSEQGAGFFMIPADTRTNTGRIWVYRSAVKTVAVS